MVKFSAVSPLEHIFDATNLYECIQNLAKKCPSFSQTNQISLRHREHHLPVDPHELLTDGVGSLYDYKTNRWWAHESQFVHNSPLIEGTYLGSVLETVKQLNYGNIGRVRILRLAPKTCYSWHQDDFPCRLHIPILTNSSAFYVTSEGGLEQLPEVGRLYKVDTGVFHTAMNASLNEDRIHLVFSLYE